MRFYLRKERNFLSEKMVIFFEENDCFVRTKWKSGRFWRLDRSFLSLFAQSACYRKVVLKRNMLLYNLFWRYFGNLRLERLAIFPLSGAGI